MRIKTYYWNNAKYSTIEILGRKLFHKLPKDYFRVGNAGDIFTHYLLKHIYPDTKIKSCGKSNSRILPVGSIAHLINDGDVITGIGSKGPEFLPTTEKKIIIFGLRGPKTTKLFKKAGYDTQRMTFQFDPGLLLNEIMPQRMVEEAKPNGSIFIPHFRERHYYKGKNFGEMRVIDVDCSPIDLGKQIINSELVFSSSLHGIIFAHSLGRPALFVAPKTSEPLFKYEDYFQSINFPMKSPIDDIENWLKYSSYESIPTLDNSIHSKAFPSFNSLIDLGVVSR